MAGGGLGMRSGCNWGSEAVYSVRDWIVSAVVGSRLFCLLKRLRNVALPFIHDEVAESGAS